MARNLERKRQYDRERYARLREENPLEVRESERVRKQAQRKRAQAPLPGDVGSIDRPYSLDSADVERQSYRDWLQDQALD